MAMELDNSFTVPVPPEQAWDVLLDVKRIAPCMPGATVDEVEGDVINGQSRSRSGPVSLTYRGTATFTERDADTRVVVLEASGKETRGAGTASATVRASLEPGPSGNSTLVTMHTTMNVTGRPAQFGRGVMVEVGGKLVDQFAANLATLLGGKARTSTAAADGGVATDATAGTTRTTRRSATESVASRRAAAPLRTGAGPGRGQGTGHRPPAPAPPAPARQILQDKTHINLVRLVGPAILKRVVPIAAIAAALALLGRRLFRRGRAKGAERGLADGGVPGGSPAPAHGAPVHRRARLDGEPGPDPGQRGPRAVRRVLAGPGLPGPDRPRGPEAFLAGGGRGGQPLR